MVKLGTDAPEFLSVDTLGLEPLDLVLMSGERVGDLTSPLEQLLVRDFRDRPEGRGRCGDVCVQEARSVDTGREIAGLRSRSRAARQARAGQPAPAAQGAQAPRHRRTSARREGPDAAHRGANAHPENPNGYDGAAAPLKDLAEPEGAGRERARRADGRRRRSCSRSWPRCSCWRRTWTSDADAGGAARVDGARAAGARGASGRRAVRRARSDAFRRARALARARQHGCAQADRGAAHRGAQARAGPHAARHRRSPAPLPSDPVEEARAQGRAVGGTPRGLYGSRAAAPRQRARRRSRCSPRIPRACRSSRRPRPVRSRATPWRSSRGCSRSPTFGRRCRRGTWWRRTTTGCATRFSTSCRFSCPHAPGAKWIGGRFDDTVHADDVVSIAMHDAPASFAVADGRTGRRRVDRARPVAGRDDRHRHAHQPAERRRAAGVTARGGTHANGTLGLDGSDRDPERHDGARRAAGRRAGRHQVACTSSCCRRSSPRSTIRG